MLKDPTTSFSGPKSPRNFRETGLWSRSDEGRLAKIALHSLDRDLRLALRNFFIHKKLNEDQEVAL